MSVSLRVQGREGGRVGVGGVVTAVCIARIQCWLVAPSFGLGAGRSFWLGILLRRVRFRPVPWLSWVGGGGCAGQAYLLVVHARGEHEPCLFG